MFTIDPPSRRNVELPAISQPALTRFLERARLAAGVTGSIGVLLTTDAGIRDLNRSFRGKDKATDVLSFPAAPEVADSCAGDLAISLDTAARQAQEFHHSTGTEVRVLLLHGLLHLAGMDHETDGGEMAAVEQALRQKLRLPVSLIARTEAIADALRPVAGVEGRRVSARRRLPVSQAAGMRRR